MEVDRMEENKKKMEENKKLKWLEKEKEKKGKVKIQDYLLGWLELCTKPNVYSVAILLKVDLRLEKVGLSEGSSA